MASPEDKDTGRGWVLTAAAIGLVVLGAVYWRFRSSNVVGTLADHANVGNAMAPAVAFLTLLAVVAALWSVQIQRTELALQRQELRETRAEMVEQRKQFERTAKAQEDLAASQASLAATQEAGNRVNQLTLEATHALAVVQREANKIAVAAAMSAQAMARNGISAQHAQRSSNVATYMAAMANIRASIEAARSPMSGTSSGERELENELLVLRAQRDLEAKRCRDLEQVMKNVDEGANA